MDCPTIQNNLQSDVEVEPPKPKRRRAWRVAIFCAIIFGIVFVAIPTVVVCGVPARPTAQRNACINNLRQIDGAKEQWALDNQSNNAPYRIEDIDNFIKGGRPVCPKGGTYTYGAINE